ncbi:MAG: amino acid adenylation domain-containing protein [Spirochaetales bacterium]|nr:amino acid adenylation domain-containing protein [Spirochaetales bacterium]
MKARLLQHYLGATAARVPEKTAVSMGEESITYGELNRKSNRLANQLIALGFRPKDSAGIYLDKSIEAVVAMFAVLKAGGVYIPLDAYYSPVSRVTGILELSGLRYLISDSGHIEALRTAAGFVSDIILMDSPAGAAGSKNTVENNPVRTHFFIDSGPVDLVAAPGIEDTDLAYVLYTSGSTGIPKGVMLTHLNARTFIEWALSRFKPEETDVFSNVAPLHFDLSVFDIYVSIAAGAALKLLPPQTAANPKAMLDWISNSGITVFYSVPSVWVSILNYADLRHGCLPGLRKILFAGEVFPPRQLKSLMELIPHAGFYNLYGPTETNVCTHYHVKGMDDVPDSGVPIGKACANTEVVAINDAGKEITAEETGELFVRGPIVTNGYYKNPEATAAAFMRSPLPRHNGAKLYRTGDLVRLTASGNLEYVGRRDLMVKKAGFRIELPEIEQALCRYAPVMEAVVVPVIVNKGESARSLTAFITLKGDSVVKVVEIKAFLAGFLPRYMIPEVITVLGEMPRNGNGKADRQKLTRQAMEAVAL